METVQEALHAEVCSMLRASALASQLETAAWRALLDIADSHVPHGTPNGFVHCSAEDYVPWPCDDFRACARAVGVEIPQ